LAKSLDEAAKIANCLLRDVRELEDIPTSEPRWGQRLPASDRKLQLLTLVRDRRLRIKDLAETLQLTPGRIAQLVNDLEAEGTAKRTKEGVKITSAGLDLVPPKTEVAIGKWQAVPTS